MDPVLAELYGTLHDVRPEPSHEELQKTAALEMLQKIAEAYEIDVAALTDEQIAEAYNELIEDGFEKDASATYEEYDEEEMAKLAAEEMFRNADYMGRTIAHAIVHELKGIQKAAAEAEGSEEKKEPPAEEKKESNPLMAAVKKEKGEGEEKDEEKEKEAAAYAEAVEYRAYEFLKQAGYVDENGNVTPPEIDKTAQEVLDRDALSVLEELGYPVQWKQG